MAFGIMAFGIMAFGIMAFGIMAFGIMAFGIMPFGIMAFSIMTFGMMADTISASFSEYRCAQCHFTGYVLTLIRLSVIWLSVVAPGINYH